MPTHILFALLWVCFTVFASLTFSWHKNLQCYFSLSFYLINFKHRHNDYFVSRYYAMTFLRFLNCPYGFIQNLLDHYVDLCLINSVHVWWSPMNGILALCNRHHDRLSVFEHPLHLIIKIHIYGSSHTKLGQWLILRVVVFEHILSIFIFFSPP